MRLALLAMTLAACAWGQAPAVLRTATGVSGVNYVAGGGTAQAQTATLVPAITSQADGLRVCWLPLAANTAAAPTLAVNGLTATTITKLGATALAASDIITTAVACAILAGANWQLQNPQTAALATFRFPLINAFAMPDNSGNVFFQPYTVPAATGADLFAHSVAIYADVSATDSLLHGQVEIPQNFVSGAKVCTVWTSTIITGDVVWGFAYRSTGGTGSLDSGTVEQTVTFAASTAPGTAQNRVAPACVVLTDANIAAGDVVQFRAARNGTSASDTMLASAISFGWWLEYQGR